MTQKHPIQPTYLDDNGTLRFKPNKIVEYLLKDQNGNFTKMNEIAVMDFSKEDRQQLAQLIGYSVSGFGGLSYVLGSGLEEIAYAQHEEGKSPEAARIEFLENELEEIKKGLRIAAAAAFNYCVEDFK